MYTHTDTHTVKELMSFYDAEAKACIQKQTEN